MILSFRLNSGSRPVLPKVKRSSRLAVPWNDLGFVGDGELLWTPSKSFLRIIWLEDGILGRNPEARALGASLLTDLYIVPTSISDSLFSH